MSEFSFSKLSPQLYLGDVKGAHDLQGLKKRGITHILQVTPDVMPKYPEHFKYSVVDIEDSTYQSIAHHLDVVADHIKSVVASNNRIFVHW
jgi:protein-tyrosine phosphatase